MAREMCMFLWKCSRCGALYAPEAIRYACPRCGDAAYLDMLPDYEAIAATWGAEELAADSRRSIWRYGPLLPVSDIRPTTNDQRPRINDSRPPNSDPSTL